MDDFKSNSQKSKEQERTITPIVQAEIVEKKGGFLESFFKRDAKNIAGAMGGNIKMFLIERVAIPTLINAVSGVGGIISGTLTDGICDIFAKQGFNVFDTRSSGSNGGTQYHRIGCNDTNSYRKDIPQSNVRPTYDNVHVATENDARNVIKTMRDMTHDEYGWVSVADLFTLVSVVPEHTDSKWGWTDLSDAGYVYDDRSPNKPWLLKFPKPIDLKK